MIVSFDIRHRHVISRQIVAYGNFSSFIMECFEKTPRSFFLPANLVDKAYVEEEVSLSRGRTVMAPLTLARLMRYLPIAPDKNIMVVGGSTGYSAAMLSYQASSVFLLESDDQFSATAQEGLSALHIDNVVMCQGNLKEGLARQGPFYFVIIDGAVEHIPLVFLINRQRIVWASLLASLKDCLWGK